MRPPFFPPPPVIGAVRHMVTWEDRRPTLALFARAIACFSVTALPVLLVAAVFIYVGSGAGLAAAAFASFAWTLAALHQVKRDHRRRFVTIGSIRRGTPTKAA